MNSKTTALRILSIFSLLSFLAGCAVPSTLNLAGYAVEGATFLQTGKSVSDHAVSAVTGQDCRLIRGVTKGTLCKKSEDALENQVTKENSKSGNDRQAKNGSRNDKKHQQSAKLNQKVTSSKWIVVVGTFPDLLMAKKSATAFAPLKTLIVTAVDDGEVIYRVTSMPFDIADAEDMKDKFVGNENPHVSLAPVCPQWMQDDKCIVIDHEVG
ncbi:MAG: hypothetical protein CMM52_04165 [Rhodospirillaceae bacterium]|nr:hypothetical protein [Rhodospirillaceae bacterium]|tara:strand:+ start:15099 stop:15731 length:633 start_codon:yes stop_codon:yes gene_type:complete